MSTAIYITIDLAVLLLAGLVAWSTMLAGLH